MRSLKILALIVAIALLAAACGSGESDSDADSGNSNTVVVHVTATEMKITSDLTTFKVGVPYRFEVTNKGTIPHEVMLVPPTDLTDMEQIDPLALGMAEEEDLVPGATVSFDYTFTEKDLNGPLELACHVPGHYEAGMKLPITVEG